MVGWTVQQEVGDCQLRCGLGALLEFSVTEHSVFVMSESGVICSQSYDCKGQGLNGKKHFLT